MRVVVFCSILVLFWVSSAFSMMQEEGGLEGRSEWVDLFSKARRASKGPGNLPLSSPSVYGPDICEGLDVLPSDELKSVKSLGRGGFGEVFIGIASGRRMAFKEIFLRPELSRAHVLEEVGRQHRAAVVGLAPRIEKDLFCIRRFQVKTLVFGMEPLDGWLTVDKYFEMIRRRSDREEKVFEFTRFALSALERLHRAEVFHHDISDTNLMVKTDEGDNIVDLRFVDFGTTTPEDGNFQYRTEGSFLLSAESLDYVAVYLLYLTAEGVYMPSTLRNPWSLQQVWDALFTSSMRQPLKQVSLERLTSIGQEAVGLGRDPIAAEKPEKEGGI